MSVHISCVVPGLDAAAWIRVWTWLPFLLVTLAMPWQMFGILCYQPVSLREGGGLALPFAVAMLSFDCVLSPWLCIRLVVAPHLVDVRFCAPLEVMVWVCSCWSLNM